MLYGIIAGITWALETVILGYALSMTPFVSTEQAIVLAPLSAPSSTTFSHPYGRLYITVCAESSNMYGAPSERAAESLYPLPQ